VPAGSDRRGAAGDSPRSTRQTVLVRLEGRHDDHVMNAPLVMPADAAADPLEVGRVVALERFRLQGGDVRAVRPGVQGRGRGHGEDHQGRPPSGRYCTRRRTSPVRWRWARSGWSATTRRSGSGRSATPPRPGHAGTRVWCRAAGEELVITSRAGRRAGEIARHRQCTPFVLVDRPTRRRASPPLPGRCDAAGGDDDVRARHRRS